MRWGITPLPAGDGSNSSSALEKAVAESVARTSPVELARTTSIRLIQGGDQAIALRVGKAGEAPPPLKELKRGTSSTVLLGEKHVPWGRLRANRTRGRVVIQRGLFR